MTELGPNAAIALSTGDYLIGHLLQQLEADWTAQEVQAAGGTGNPHAQPAGC